MKKGFLLIVLLVSLFANAQLYSSAALRAKVITLRRFLEQQHYQPLQWNDSSSVRLYEHWLKILDDDKMLFIKTDMAQAEMLRYKLDDELQGKEWSFFDKTVKLYQSRLQVLDTLVKNILAKPLDFSKAETIHWPLADYAATPAEFYSRWQKYLKWKVLRAVADELSDTSKGTSLSEKIPVNFAALEIKAREKVKKQELLFSKSALDTKTFEADMEDEYLGAVSWCYDPHTEYMNLDAKNDFENEVNSLEYSAGIEVKKNEKGDWEISYLEPGGPAWRNGELHKGDVLLKISTAGKTIEAAEMEDDQWGPYLRGTASENITVTVRSLSGQQKSVALTKEKITNDEGIVKSYVLNGEKKIGYITLPGFYSKEEEVEDANGCSNDVAKEVVKLKKDSISGLILDLRFNGGGSMWEALQLAGIFIGEGPLASTKDKTGKVHFLKDPNRGTIYDGPLLVLVNGTSASASELVSAVLQDYHRAIIVGSTTYGKGTAQIVLPMDTSGQFSKNIKYENFVKVTEEKFYRINGNTTQWNGVIPDIQLPDVFDNNDFSEKKRVSALQPDQSKTAIYEPLEALPVNLLMAKSAARVAADENFNNAKQFADWYWNSKGRDVPLQWAPYVTAYKKITAIYETVEKPGSKTIPVITAVNNHLDEERFKFAAAAGKEVNAAYLKKITADGYINEACKILYDWINSVK